MKATHGNVTFLWFFLLRYQFSFRCVNEILCSSYSLFVNKFLKLDNFVTTGQLILTSTTYSHYEITFGPDPVHLIICPLLCLSVPFNFYFLSFPLFPFFFEACLVSTYCCYMKKTDNDLSA